MIGNTKTDIGARPISDRVTTHVPARTLQHIWLERNERNTTEEAPHNNRPRRGGVMPVKKRRRVQGNGTPRSVENAISMPKGVAI